MGNKQSVAGLRSAWPAFCFRAPCIIVLDSLFSSCSPDEDVSRSRDEAVQNIREYVRNPRVLVVASFGVLTVPLFIVLLLDWSIGFWYSVI